MKLGQSDLPPLAVEMVVEATTWVIARKPSFEVVRVRRTHPQKTGNSLRQPDSASPSKVLLELGIVLQIIPAPNMRQTQGPCMSATSTGGADTLYKVETKASLLKSDIFFLIEATQQSYKYGY